MKIQTNITDCGRIPGERKDCAVRALAGYLNIEYIKAHEMLSPYRKPCRGVYTVDVYPKFGLAYIKLNITLKKFLDVFGGNCIVRVKNHVFFLKDGIPQDLVACGPNKIVRGIFIHE